jgi:hypothetical protein
MAPSLRSGCIKKSMLVLLLLASAAAQRPNLEPDVRTAPEHPTVATITFSLSFPGSVPSHYTLAVDATGRAAYRSDAPQDTSTSANAIRPGQPLPTEPYLLNFTMSQPTRDRLFQLAEQLNYFQGNFDYTKRRIASGGAKTLVFGDLTRHNETTYNWSENPQVQEITRIFQNISMTLEFGRRIEYDLRYDRLGVDSELRRMEEAAKNKELAELQAIEPVLRRVANDPAVLHIARVRADKLLARIEPPADARP